MCACRDVCLFKAGCGDIFKAVKDKENAEALSLLPGLVQEHDSIHDGSVRLEVVLRGVFAGEVVSWASKECTTELHA